MMDKEILTRTWFTSTTNVLLLGVVLILLLLVFMSDRRENALLMKLPGPKPYPIVGNTLEIFGNNVKTFLKTMKLIRKYGPIFRLYFGNKRRIYVTHPHYLKEVLGNTKHIKKGEFYNFLRPITGNGLFTADECHWQKQRKTLTPAFHMNILTSYFPIFKGQWKMLRERLDLKANSGAEINIEKYLSCTALNTIAEAAMGVKLNRENNADGNYINSVARTTHIFTERTTKFWLYSNFLFKMSKLGRDFYSSCAYGREFIKSVISQRKEILGSRSESNEAERKRRLFLDILLENPESHKLAVSNEYLVDEVSTFMIAGHETTANSMSWTCFLLGHHPEIQEQLFQEQMDLTEGALDSEITDADIGKMDLLERVVKESLRLYPPAPLMSRYLEKDIKLGEYLVPKNTTMVIHIYGMHRNPDVFQDPDKFDPDRFLPENFDKLPTFAFIPFSGGPRNCIGKRFAMLEMMFLMSSLIRRYKFQSIEKPEDLQLVAELVLRSLNGIKVKLTKRDIP